MELTKLGTINKAQGIKGEVKAYIEDITMSNVKTLEALFIEFKTGPIPYFLEDARKGEKNTYYLLFEGIDDRNKAEALAGKDILIEKKNLKKPKSDGYEFAIGFTLVDSEHGELGVIDDVYDLPANQVAVLHIEGKEHLLPLNEQFVTKADKRKKILHTTLPEGLLDIYK
ncbi:MAG TPA: ribosome maturation factor RimM [Chitinophagales bacterium]|nr:ribosome maturation factor RimM [Chitinophagales bacterium]